MGKADDSYEALKALRDSGYRGPVDEDGKATTHEDWRAKHGIDPATGTAVR
ncbi:hypothetical protein [Pseudonocardia sp. NPDC049635]|uniref:hypothetical protein n=1 Tax=Pseudonocardia sp. NPDC049635 TaxID=3155506 RepID=UPI0033CC6054